METNTIKGFIEEASVKIGNTNGKEWKRAVLRVNGKTMASFDENYAKDISEGRLKVGLPIEVNYTTDGKYNTFTNIFLTEAKNIQPLSDFKTAKNKEVDWKAISRGKVRHGVAVAFIQHKGLVELNGEIIDRMEKFVDYIMEGKKEGGKIDESVF